MRGAEAARPQVDFRTTKPFRPQEFLPAERKIMQIGLRPSSEKTPLPPFGTIVSLTGKEKKSASPDIFSREWLMHEVTKEREKPVFMGETPWYHLPGTGFWVKEQVSQLLRNVTKAGKEAFPDVLDRELSKVKMDTIAFEDEYLKQLISLRWNLAIGTENGRQRIICPDYGNGTLESVTSKDERDGVVYETLFGNKKKGIMGIEEQIINAPAGTMAVIVSPEGWSGLKDAAGNNIRYPESQIYVIMKLADGRLQAYTFRCKANILQNETLQRSLGLATPEITDQKDRIKSVFRNVAIITPDDAAQAESEGRRSVRGFEDVVDLMEQAVGGRKEAYENKTFDDMRAYLRHPERFNKRHPLTEKLIKRFEDYVQWRLSQGGRYEDVKRDLQIALAFNPTQLGKLYREEGDVTIVTYGNGMRSEALAEQRLIKYIQMPGGIDYRRELKYLQERPGCAGGGSSTSVFSMGGSRKGEIGNNSSSEHYDFDHDGICVNCGGGPTPLGPCDICIPCDAEMGGEGAELIGKIENKKDVALAA